MITEILFDNRSEITDTEFIYTEIERAIITTTKKFTFEVGFQVSVSLVENNEIKELNAKFRNTDSVTDVLSFPMEDSDHRNVELLGDIVICVSRAEEQAKEFGHTFKRELSYLTVHSTLHLLGYDHMQEDEKKEMRNLEKEIMNDMGIYKVTELEMNLEYITKEQEKQIIETAKIARDSAYCPYSKFRVGSAILTSNNKIYYGCNIENASYPATICAERTAAVKAISEGEKKFKAIVVAVYNDSYAYPCGVCRQFLYEFSDENTIIIVVNGKDEIEKTTLGALLPNGFKGEDMN